MAVMRERAGSVVAAFCVALAIPLAANLLAINDDVRLVEAAQKQDAKAVRGLLSQRVDVNVAQPDGATALAWAVHWNNLETADLLIRAGADANRANELGMTPLMLACRNGSAAMVDRLLKAGADPAAARSNGETALMMAARVGTVEAVTALLAHGADPNAKTIGGHTALMWAAAERHADVARLLIGAGADVHARSQVIRKSQGRSEYGAPKAPAPRGKLEAFNPLSLPGEGAEDVPRAEGGFTALLYAALAGDGDIVRALLAANASVDEAGPDGVTALMLALIKRHEDVALLLLAQNANPNAADAGFNALHVASAMGQIAAAKSLLAHGADPNAALEKPYRLWEAFEPGTNLSPGVGRLVEVGATPFMVAAKTVNAPVMRVLADAGADARRTTNDGTTALMLAAGLGKRWSATWYTWTDAKALEATKVGLQFGIDINATNQFGATALHAATYHAANDLIRFLVERGANINARDSEDQTPLRLAEGHLICCTSFIQHPLTAELLRKLGADPNVGTRLNFALRPSEDEVSK